MVSLARLVAVSVDLLERRDNRPRGGRPMAGCEDLVRDLLMFGGHGSEPGAAPTSRARRQDCVIVALVASGLQPVSLTNLPVDVPAKQRYQLWTLCDNLLEPFGVHMKRPKGGLQLECPCGRADACWLHHPHDDERLDAYFRVHAATGENGVTAFPAGSTADDLLWSDEPVHGYAQEMLVRLLLPLSQRHPDGTELAQWLRLSDPRTVVAVGLEGGGETMRFVYELLQSHPPSGEAAANPSRRYEYPGGADAGSNLAARRAFSELARVRAAERIDLGRTPSQENRRKRVELVVVAAMASVNAENLDEVTGAVRDVMRDTHQRGWVLILNDNLPSLLPNALTGLTAPPAVFGRGAEGLGADHADIAVKIGAGTVLHAVGIEERTMRLSGADYLFSDEGGGFDIAVQAFRRTVRYLQSVVLRPLAEGDPAYDELAAEAGKFVGVDAAHWRSLSGRGTNGVDARLVYDERRQILAGLTRASLAWARDPAMKRRISPFAIIVCKLADFGNPEATLIVRAAAKEIGDLLDAAVRARHDAVPDGPGSVVIVSGKIPTHCATYQESIRSRLSTIAGNERHAIALYVVQETTGCALSAAKWLHRHLRSGGSVRSDLLLESRLIRVDNFPLRGGALA